MTVRSYPEYRESGLEWIGKVPAHWKCCALNYRYEIALGKMLDEKLYTGDSPGPYLRNSDVQWARINTSDLPVMDFSGSDLTRYSLRTGDLLVCEGGEVGRAAIWDGKIEPCYYQKALHRIRPRDRKKDSAKFLFYVFRAMSERGLFEGGEGKSTIAHLPAETLCRYIFPFPDSSEQFAIAAFLDRETGKIDALVAEQERLIALLKEKRQAVISYAVTKGLNPNAPMKDSGVPWLGEIPAHWRLLAISKLFRFVKRQERASLEVLSVYRDYGVLIKSTRSDNINKTPEDLSLYQTVKIHDLVINKMKAWQGSLGISDYDGITSPDYAVFEPVSDGVSGYFNFLLRSRLLPEVYRTLSNGIRPDQWRLEPDKFKGLCVPVPPVEEQGAIHEALVVRVKSFGRLISEAEHASTLLLERRAALISAAVTGKIDVRDEVAMSEAA